MNEKGITEENPEILRVQELVRRMNRVNQDIEEILARTPLTHHREVARLNRLIQEQVRLVGSSPQTPLPPRITVFYDNARDKASFLYQRYRETILSGALRSPENTD